MRPARLTSLRSVVSHGPLVVRHSFPQLRVYCSKAQRVGSQSAMPTTPDCTAVSSSTSLLSRVIDQPFETWQSIFLSLAFFFAFALVVVFLGRRYVELLTFNAYSCSNPPATLEGQRAWEEASSVVDAHTNPDDGSGVRQRPRLVYVQPSIVAIGKVQAGKIAQRRASSSRIVSDKAQ
ncbi:hypothetical protein EDD37DRAFT_497378 [Exophiala viscosa]|uniref:Uncharacterized protein n=1 Tax=Exophiala viscosa TaxID=2486360 RepID=A0AAN6E221_9EURO|nr:hypothetical protein EDD36DRAFT_193417 [Exophiala viscosa]KAI1621826.1 hypothetical protein EDD37DRAFT_497378 [Exophiala viscosa]